MSTPKKRPQEHSLQRVHNLKKGIWPNVFNPMCVWTCIHVYVNWTRLRKITLGEKNSTQRECDYDRLITYVANVLGPEF